MNFSKKTLYALRAVFELAKQYGDNPVTIADIAKAQSLPPRFLENILFQLKAGGILESTRGREGGYRLARPPHMLSVGDVLRVMEVTINPVSCMEGKLQENCPMRDNCVFLPMWVRAQTAMIAVYDSSTYADLVAQYCCPSNKTTPPFQAS